MNNAITEFKGEYRFLSNFWMCPVELDGVIYPSSEHAYMAAKTLDVGLRTSLLGLYPGQAKKQARTFQLRENWEEIKFDIMYAVVSDKFNRTTSLANALRATRSAELIEGNTWGDTIWGVCNGVGENNLGKILMRVREVQLKK